MSSDLSQADLQSLDRRKWHASIVTGAWVALVVALFVWPLLGDWAPTVSDALWRGVMYPAGVLACLLAVTVCVYSGKAAIWDGKPMTLANEPWLAATSLFLILFPPAWFMCESRCYDNNLITGLTILHTVPGDAGRIKTQTVPVMSTEQKTAFMEDLHHGQERAGKIWLAVGGLLTVVLSNLKGESQTPICCNRAPDAHSSGSFSGGTGSDKTCKPEQSSEPDASKAPPAKLHDGKPPAPTGSGGE